MLFALGVGDEVTAVTHECDFPPEALELPRITRDVIGPGLSSGEIDRAVRELTLEGRSIYVLDEQLLRSLQPDLIVTQALCTVCAVSIDDVRALAGQMDPPPEVLSLDSHTIGEVLGDVRTVARATGNEDAGVALVEQAARRIDAVRLAVRDARPVAVAALEWLDPVYSAGHWTPQLIELAGGHDVLGLPGEQLRDADVGRGEVRRSRGRRRDALRVRRRARARGGRGPRGRARGAGRAPGGLRRRRAYYSRPGPRLVDGLELMAHVLHPDRVPAPSPGGLLEFALD